MLQMVLPGVMRGVRGVGRGGLKPHQKTEVEQFTHPAWLCGWQRRGAELLAGLEYGLLNRIDNNNNFCLWNHPPLPVFVALPEISCGGVTGPPAFPQRQHGPPGGPWWCCRLCCVEEWSPACDVCCLLLLVVSLLGSPDTD
mgnify:CR=1 FL=1